MAVDPELEMQELSETMQEAFAQVKTAEITYAARNSDFGGFAIQQGDYLALLEHQLFGTDQNLEALVEKLLQSAEIQNAEFISVFYGEDVTEEQATKMEQLIVDACPNAEVNLLYGGQPVYYYMISVE